MHKQKHLPSNELKYFGNHSELKDTGLRIEGPLHTNAILFEMQVCNTHNLVLATPTLGYVISYKTQN